MFDALFWLSIILAQLLLIAMTFLFIAMALGVRKKLHISLDLWRRSILKQDIVLEKRSDLLVLFVGVVMLIHGRIRIQFTNLIVGRVRGGLAQVNVLASMFFGGISGSAVADVSSLGTIMIPMIKKKGHDGDYSVPVAVTSACQGIITPPSHNMIIYSLAAGGASVGRCFFGGFIPGVILFSSLKPQALVMSLIASASAFGWLLAFLPIPAKVTEGLLAIPESRVALRLPVNLLLLPREP